MSWNATVDRLRGQAQQYGLASDYVTAKLLYQAVDEIERIARERDEARAQAAVWRDAQNDPPQSSRIVVVDGARLMRHDGGRWRVFSGSEPLRPPRVWCDIPNLPDENER